jgi:hypothetical protein
MSVSFAEDRQDVPILTQDLPKRERREWLQRTTMIIWNILVAFERDTFGNQLMAYDCLKNKYYLK